MDTGPTSDLHQPVVFSALEATTTFKLNYPSTDHNHVIKPVRVQSNSSPPAKKRLKENVGVEPSLLTYKRETRRLLHVSGSHNFPVHTHSNMTMKSG